MAQKRKVLFLCANGKEIFTRRLLIIQKKRTVAGAEGMTKDAYKSWR